MGSQNLHTGEAEIEEYLCKSLIEILGGIELSQLIHSKYNLLL